jgi:hypothetical protein
MIEPLHFVAPRHSYPTAVDTLDLLLPEEFRFVLL